MRLVIYSQYEENYGAHDWNGQGTCPQYWKQKGGSEYQMNISSDSCVRLGNKGLANLVDTLAELHINKSSEYSNESMFDWEILDNGESTEMEKLFGDGSYSYSPIKLN